MPHRLTQSLITSEAELRGLIGDPTAVVRSKLAPRLNALTRRFIEASPLVLVATADAQGHCDVSPRGDPAGFVRILDDATLLVPERPGNKLADSLRNILANPSVGLLFVIPGVGDTFRVNGRAVITTDEALLAPCAVKGVAPKLGLIVDIEVCFTQCPKAFIRSKLWDPTRFVARESLPTNGQIHAVLCEGFDGEAYDRERAARYARGEGLY